MKNLLALLVLLPGLALGQNVLINPQIQGGINTGAAFRLLGGTTLPATCQENQIFVKTNDPIATQIYICTSTNTWTNQAGAVGSLVLPANGGTGIANNNLSTFTITGSYPLAFTISAGTGVTLPTTGTLSTLAGSETLSNKTLSNPAATTAALTDASTTTWNANTNGTDVTWTLTASGHTLGAMSNPVVGGTYTVAIIQPSSAGPDLVTFDSSYKFPSGIAPVLSTANNAVDLVVCKYLASQMNCSPQYAFK